MQVIWGREQRHQLFDVGMSGLRNCGKPVRLHDGHSAKQLREGPPLIVPVITATVLPGVAGGGGQTRPGPARCPAAGPVPVRRLGLSEQHSSGPTGRRGPSNPPTGHAPPTVTQLLVGTGIVLATNIVTFGLLYSQLDSCGPSGRLAHSVGALINLSPDERRGSETARHG